MRRAAIHFSLPPRALRRSRWARLRSAASTCPSLWRPCSSRPGERSRPPPARKTTRWKRGMRRRGSMSGVEASGVAFVDERRALLLVMTDTSADVQEVTFDGSTPVNGWRERISGVHSAALTYLPRANRWVLLGRDESNRFVRAEGIVGQPGVTTMTWTGLSSRGSWIDAIATHDASVLIAERHYEFGIWREIPLLGIVPHLARYPETRLARIEGDARIEAGFSRLETTCTAGTLPEERIVCAAFDGTRTHLAAIDPATAAVTPLVMLDGRFWGGNVVADGWTSGWWESGPAAIHLATHAVVRAPRIADEFVSLLTATDAVVATVSPMDEGARVRLYPTRGATQSARRDE